MLNYKMRNAINYEIGPKYSNKFYHATPVSKEYPNDCLYYKSPHAINSLTFGFEMSCLYPHWFNKLYDYRTKEYKLVHNYIPNVIKTTELNKDLVFQLAFIVILAKYHGYVMQKFDYEVVKTTDKYIRMYGMKVPSHGQRILITGYDKIALTHKFDEKEQVKIFNLLLDNKSVDIISRNIRFKAKPKKGKFLGENQHYRLYASGDYIMQINKKSSQDLTENRFAFEMETVYPFHFMRLYYYYGDVRIYEKCPYSLSTFKFKNIHQRYSLICQYINLILIIKSRGYTYNNPTKDSIGVQPISDKDLYLAGVDCHIDPQGVLIVLMDYGCVNSKGNINLEIFDASLPSGSGLKKIFNYAKLKLKH